jgi:hypothetical protein
VYHRGVVLVPSRRRPPLRVAFVVPYGERDPGFFPDTLAMVLAARASALGHEVHAVRAWYDGHSPDRDASVRASLSAWLVERGPGLVVVERLFDPAALDALRRARPDVRVLLVSWGDAQDAEGVDLVLGAHAGRDRGRRTRRSPSAGELVLAFEQLLAALAEGAALEGVPGLAFATSQGWQSGPEPRSASLPRPFSIWLRWDDLVHGPPPPRARIFVFGNSGCPYARDPAHEPHYRGLALDAPGLSRLGCAFCQAGGDYEKRPDEQVIDELLEQAEVFARAFPEVTERVIVDQSPERFLPALIEGAAARGLRPGRWLFSARADAFLRDHGRLTQAIEAAARTGQRLEVFLSGFESFSDAELDRYNKGVTADELVRAVSAMRALARAHPDVFEFRRARGHSLLLWSPWTRPEDLRANVERFRAHGLLELFEDVARNRLRLYPGLPITLAAERDGALTESWEAGDRGAAQLKGYAVERPWRFLDPRTRLARGLTEALREEVGAESEITLLAAAAEYAERFAGSAPEVPGELSRVLDGVRELAAGLARCGSGASEARVRAAVVRFAGACNSGCPTCPHRERPLDDGLAALEERVDAARAAGRAIAFAGREPTIHPGFLPLLGRARGSDRRPVFVIGNGRRFAVPRFAEAAGRSGLVGASVKLFAPDAATADAIARDPGAFAQSLAGIEALRGVGVRALEVRIPLHARTVDRVLAYLPLCRALGVGAVRIEVALDALGLGRAGAAARALDALAEAAAAEGIGLFASPLRGGAARFDEVPAVPASSAPAGSA